MLVNERSEYSKTRLEFSTYPKGLKILNLIYIPVERAFSNLGMTVK